MHGHQQQQRIVKSIPGLFMAVDLAISFLAYQCFTKIIKAV